MESSQVIQLGEFLPKEDSDGEEDGFYIKDRTVLTKREARSLLGTGCSICGSPITLEDFNEVEWHYDDQPICVGCIDDVEWSQI